MGLFTPRKESFRFRRIIAAALFFIILDGFIVGLPVFGLFICLSILVACGIASIIFIFSKREFSKLYAIKFFIYLCACVSIIGVYRMNVLVGKRNADKIINSVGMYRSDEGAYPRELSDLVPEYLSSIPVCAYRLSSRQYRYSYADNYPYLMWAETPPFGRRMYHFEDQGWTYID
jgi:hypothetical protein